MVFKVVMAAAALNAAIASVACAEGTPVGYSIFGTPGLIEMPIATPAPDAEIAMSLGGFEDQQRASFTFQITPRLSGTFRYARLDEYTGPGTDDTFDRSFDLQYQLVTEGEYRPSIAFGLRDFMGTGLYTNVRRQGFWHQWWLKLRESLAHLVGCIMRRVVCDASGVLRSSCV